MTVRYEALPENRLQAGGASGPAPAMELGPARAITYLRISVTDLCNLRCQYCMPEDTQFLDREELLAFEEIAQVAGTLVRHGVRKIRLTGGEPLLRRDLPALVAKLKALPGLPEVVMTTNGMLLQRHARALREAGLDRLNVSLDTLRPERFRRIARRPGLDDVLAGLDAVRAAGFEGTKLNTVVMGGVNDDELEDLLAFAARHGFEQRFIEFMPLQSNDFGIHATRVPLPELRLRLSAISPLDPRPRGSGPADTFVLRSTGQRLGLISAISLPFCETCNRVRLTSDGVLRSCLFEGGEVSIRDLVRSGQNVDAGLEQALDWLRRVKPIVHEGFGYVAMNRVGG